MPTSGLVERRALGAEFGFAFLEQFIGLIQLVTPEIMGYMSLTLPPALARSRARS